MASTVMKSAGTQPTDLFSAAVTSMQVPLSRTWQQHGTQVSLVFPLLGFRNMTHRPSSLKVFCCFPEEGNNRAGGGGVRLNKHRNCKAIQNRGVVALGLWQQVRCVWITC